MDARFETVPLPYGAVHFAILGAVLAVCVLWAWLLRKQKPERLIRLIAALGVFMLLTEVWKQWFVHRYVYEGPSSWFFPWQLCSMTMYCAAVLPILKGKAQDTVLAFLCSYNPVASFFALLFPTDMMRPQILLFTHSFLYHALMLLIWLAALSVLKRRERVRFLPVLLLFLGMAAIAEGINVISHAIIGNIYTEANMFYITPYYPSTQPVFRTIAVRLGILPEILLYLASISAGSYGVYRLGLLLAKRSRSGRQTENP